MELKPLLETALAAALEAGEAVLEIYGTDFSVDYKEDRSPLTRADRAAHEIIARRLKPTALPVLSEEGRDIPYDERRRWEAFWLVDPLDGTKEFVNRNGEFTVNIALVRGSRPAAGVVYAPVFGRLYLAWEGGGAHRWQAPEPPAPREERAYPRPGIDPILAAARRLPDTDPEGPGYTIVGSRSHRTPELEAFVARKRAEHGEVRYVPAGSSLKFCLVAEGRARMYPRLGPTMEWDTAAGQAVAEAAGGRVVDFSSGEPLAYNKTSLKNPWFVVLHPGEPYRPPEGEARAEKDVL